MSTMLKTTNPSAVAEADPSSDRRVPYVGQAVLFHARPGEGRAGRVVSPALVLRVEDDDHADLLIIYDADDFIVRQKIPRKTDQNNINAWSFNEHDQKNYMLIEQLAKQLAEHGGQLSDLRLRLEKLEARRPRAIAD